MSRCEGAARWKRFALLVAVGALAVLAAVPGCGNTGPANSRRIDGVVAERRVEDLEDRILEIHAEEGGGVLLGLARSARWHRIDPDGSPDARALVVLARDARDTGRAVRITIDATGTPRSKTPPRGTDSGPGALPVVLKIERVAE